MKKYLISIIITILTIIIILWFIPFRRIPDIPKQIKIPGILLGFIFYLLSYVAVSLRWRILFSQGMENKRPLPRPLLFLITSAHQLIANILPARAGDITIVYLAKRHLKVDSTLAMSSLIIARAFDVMVLGILSLVFIILHHENSLIFHPGATSVALLFVSVPVLGIIICLLKGKGVEAWLNRYALPFSRKRHWVWGEKITLFLAQTARLLSIRRSNIFYIKCISVTILVMLLRIAYLSMFALFAVNPIALGIAPVVGLSTLVVSATPIQGFLGLGAFEGGWVLGYALTGLSTEMGLLTAVGAHLLIIIFILFTGILCNLILLKIASDTTPKQDPPM